MSHLFTDYGAVMRFVGDGGRWVEWTPWFGEGTSAGNEGLVGRGAWAVDMDNLRFIRRPEAISSFTAS